MSAIFKHRRVVALGDIPEDDPNTTKPDEATVFKLAKRLPSGDKLTTGHNIMFEFLDGSGNPIVGPTVAWQTWMRNDECNVPGQNVWGNLLICTGGGAYELFVTEDVRNGDLFVQLLSITDPGATAQVVIYVAEI